MSEASKQTFVVIDARALADPKEHPRVYGSALSGADTEESDLDLLVDATETTTS